MADFRQRLEEFLKSKKQKTDIGQLTPDASTREYFRIRWNDSTAIACVYPEAFNAGEQTYLDVTNLFRQADLPVAEIYEFSESLGIIILEDFGDSVLRDVLLQSGEVEREKLLNEAITLIAEIQAATPLAFEVNSIASRLKFDEEKLFWELNFFKTHYFETFRRIKLSDDDDAAINKEFIELARKLENRAKVLCHRDFHTANLMIDIQNKLRIIDHQDARIGSVTYDLVSLLLDRVLQMPDELWLKEKKYYFLNERKRLNLDQIDPTAFDNEFALMTVQRCLKAVGTFSFQSVNRGKTYFLPFIEPMLKIVLEACRNLKRFPNLQAVIERQLNP